LEVCILDVTTITKHRAMTLTTTLNNRIAGNNKFVAKKTQFGINAVGYANYTQARKAQSKLANMGVETELWQSGRPIYLKIK
jgi:hypothetical protein